MPLQPTDVPSRAGIQAAIDEAVDLGVSEAHSESAVHVCTATGANITGAVRFKLILDGRLAIAWFSLAVVNAISVPADGNNADAGQSFPAVPSPYRPAQTINIPGRAVNAAGGVPCWLNFNQSGYLAVSRFEATGSAYSIAAGDTLQGQLIYIPEGQDA